MFLLIACARGAFSASTKLCASAAESIPEPLPKAFITFWPVADLLSVVELLALLVLLVVDVLVVDDVDVETDETMVVSALG